MFEDDKDRYGWLDLMEKCGARFGWRVHAWVLMGNHFKIAADYIHLNPVRSGWVGVETGKRLRSIVRQRKMGRGNDLGRGAEPG